MVGEGGHSREADHEPFCLLVTIMVTIMMSHWLQVLLVSVLARLVLVSLMVGRPCSMMLTSLVSDTFVLQALSACFLQNYRACTAARLAYQC
jgi:hypothetical protein